MTWQDSVNGAYEALGSVAIWANVWNLYRDKQYRGVLASVMFFFTSWGYWNLYYYWHLNQMLSWIAGVSLTVANTIYLGLMFYYRRRDGI